MIPEPNEILSNCPDCRNIKCTCPKQFGKRIPMKNSNEQQVPEWDKKFDRLWMKESGLPADGGIKFTEPYKKFIRSLLSSHHAHLKERVMQLDMKMILNEIEGGKPDVLAYVKKGEVLDLLE